MIKLFINMFHFQINNLLQTCDCDSYFARFVTAIHLCTLL